jgi:hypothetical protein
MSQTYHTTLEPLYDVIKQCLFMASQTVPSIREHAVASHVRIRSKTPEQFEFFRLFANDPGYFDISKTVQHKGREVIFCRMRDCHYYFKENLQQRIQWLEFTGPREEHEDGPDALVFKISWLTEAIEEKVLNYPLFQLRYQALSADNIVNK